MKTRRKPPYHPTLITCLVPPTTIQDTSLAPGLTDPSIVSSFEAVLGKGYRFGYSGTLSLCSRITKAIKSLDLGCPLVG